MFLVYLVFLVFRLATALAVIILAARQRMWMSLVFGVGLLVVEPCCFVVAILGGDGGAGAVLWTYLAVGGLALAGWRAGARFRARHGDSASRREVSHLPLLYSVWIVLAFVVALAFHALRA